MRRQGSCRAEKLLFRRVGLLPDRDENRLDVGRGFIPRRENLSAGCKTLPYKVNWARQRRALRSISAYSVGNFLLVAHDKATLRASAAFSDLNECREVITELVKVGDN